MFMDYFVKKYSMLHVYMQLLYFFVRAGEKKY